MTPRLLDLFCGGGGASMGYHRAGFEVVGVDISPQPRYPFEFVQADALTFALDGFDAIHASPPCLAFTVFQSMHKNRLRHPDLITPLRPRLAQAAVPWVIENVPGAPLRQPYVICGGALGLGANGRYLRRHRLFECSFPLLVPPCSHQLPRAVGVYGGGEWRDKRAGGYQAGAVEARAAMGIEWMTKAELAQAVPPDYTELIGYQLRAAL